MANFDLYMHNCCKSLDDLFDEIISLEKDPLIADPLKYMLEAGGKRVRPLLLMTVAQMFTGSIENTVYPALSMEYVHNFSLIHDDLPCMDDDDMRRGKPTMHKVFGEARALLIGDALMINAFELLEQAPNLTDTQKLKLIKILANASGSKGMIYGQILDVGGDAHTLSSQDLKKVHQLKTGALFKGAMEMGAIIASASQEEVDKISYIGALVGEAFQIMDDILDYKEGELESTNSVFILGMEQSKKNIEDLFKEMKNILNTFIYPTELLQDLLYYLVYRQQPALK